MSIEVPVLDNRRFQDIVDEAKRKIPGYAPEWTNHNVSDPGVALIELFAWMTDLTLYQLNQLPDRAMKQLLDTIGFEMFPAQAARVDLEFKIGHPPATGVVFEIPPPVLIPRGTEVGTVGLDDNVTFSTQHPLELHQPVLRQCVRASATGEKEPPFWSDGSGLILRALEFDDPFVCFTGLEVDERSTAGFDPRALRHGTAVYFGFDRPLSRAVVEVAVKADTKGLGIDVRHPPITWEASTAEGFGTCEMVDGTGGLNTDGAIRIQIPAGHRRTTMPIGGDDLYWLALRLDTDAMGPLYTRSPLLDEISFTTVGGVVEAANVERRSGRELGRSDGTPGQRFLVGESIVLGEENVDVSVAGERWQYVADFSNTGDQEPVYTVDAVAGEIRFAPETRLPDGATRRHGKVPEKDAVVAANFHVGGGAAGARVGAGEITNLHKALAYVDSVTNRRAPTQARDGETIVEAVERAPAAVRAGDRAVTAADFERIVKDADRTLERVVCRQWPPIDAGIGDRADAARDAKVVVLIVPPVSKAAALHELDDYALSPELRHRVTRHLEPRRLVGTRVELATPKFLGVSVAVRLRCKKGFERDAVKARVADVLYQFVNPIVGGEDGRGLRLGETLTQDRVEARIEALDGVRRIEVLEMFEADLRLQRRLGGGPMRRIEIDPDTVLLSFRHVVHVESEED